MTPSNFRRVVVLALLTALSACQHPSPQRGATTPTSPLLLISLDGFAADYWNLHPEAMPNLRRLSREGVVADGLIPVFPSNTFPNHYTLVTGLYPSQHGMINNEFFDPALGAFFRYFQESDARDARWWSGEPIWATSIKQGKLAATSFWVGSEAAIGGMRPTYSRPFDARVPFEARLEDFNGWLNKPVELRPSLIAIYIEETNGAGHRFGPKSAESVAAIKLVDDRVGQILQQCTRDGFTPNVVIVSDHGMVAVDPARVATLDDYIDLNVVQIDSEGSVAGLRVSADKVDALMDQVSRIPHAKAYRVADLPAHFHASENARLSPVWVLPEEGAHVVKKATLARLQKRFPEHGYVAGDHGYDPSLGSMHGIFVAHGPAFRRGITLPTVENVHVYNLLCAVLGVTPAPNSGDDRLVRSALKK